MPEKLGLNCYSFNEDMGYWICEAAGKSQHGLWHLAKRSYVENFSLITEIALKGK
jgi:hypothetical protein